MTTPPDHNTDSPRGLLYALAAYGIWGVLPLYMKQIGHIPAPEIIAHRILWSLPVAGAVLIWQGRAGDVIAALRNPRMMAMATLTAALITVNWTVYVWAITHDRAIQAALGYYINPLFSVLVGGLLLGERLGRAQLGAIALAFVAVVILTVDAGRLPAVALALTFSWGLYAYFKRSLPLGPNQGFTLEVIVLSPFALGWLIWLARQDASHFGGNAHDTLFLIGAGVATAVPLMFYANGAKLVRLSTIGIMQYMTPTMIFLFAVLAFGEPFGGAQLLAFPLIWAALAIYSVALLRDARRRRRTRRELAAQRAQ